MSAKKKQYQKARQCMVESQIHPMGISDERILEAFTTVPREQFVPEEKCGICYCDEDIEIADGRYLMEPSVLARLAQAAELKKDDVVLTIGSGIGYNAAILSQLVTTVVALEENLDLVKQAQTSWDALSYCNIAGVEGPIRDGAPEHAPYDVIIINGAVCDVPNTIREQLTIGGRLLTLVKPAGERVAKATKIERTDKNVFKETILFDSGTPYLKGYTPKKEFVFS